MTSVRDRRPSGFAPRDYDRPFLCEPPEKRYEGARRVGKAILRRALDLTG
jgi:hypothetical protein